jgi:thiol-disulfide isomerase/thioredoxin
VLLNFWATWCAPCVREMPSLNRLAAEMAGDGLAVVPVAIDRAGLSAVIPFYRDHGLDNLAMYLDPYQHTAYTRTRNSNNAEFALYGLPISYLVDRQGRVRGYIAGAVYSRRPRTCSATTRDRSKADACRSTSMGPARPSVLSACLACRPLSCSIAMARKSAACLAQPSGTVLRWWGSCDYLKRSAADEQREWLAQVDHSSSRRARHPIPSSNRTDSSLDYQEIER